MKYSEEMQRNIQKESTCNWSISLFKVCDTRQGSDGQHKYSVVIHVHLL